MQRWRFARLAVCVFGGLRGWRFEWFVVCGPLSSIPTAGLGFHGDADAAGTYYLFRICFPLVISFFHTRKVSEI